MARLRRKTISPWVVVAVVALAMTTWAVAGEYHHGTHLSCSQCHVMHGSYNGTLYGGGDGVAKLLKGEVNGICLGCHNSSTSNRDIVASGTAGAPNDTLAGVAFASKYKNSSGFFQSDYATVDSPVGHDLGPISDIAPQGTWASGSTGMKCIDCHDPHGSENYRNLLEEPGNAGAPIDVTYSIADEAGKAIYTDPTKIAGGWTQKMDTDSIAFADPTKIVDWCMGCHENITTGSKHPQNAALSGPAADGAHWDAGTGTGFGTDVGDGTAGIPRVRFAQAGDSYTLAHDPADTNKVFCLSCHKAHGSKYDSAVVWPHYEDGAADRTSGCGQCHNSGA